MPGLQLLPFFSYYRKKKLGGKITLLHTQIRVKWCNILVYIFLNCILIPWINKVNKKICFWHEPGVLLCRNLDWEVQWANFFLWFETPRILIIWNWTSKRSSWWCSDLLSRCRLIEGIFGTNASLWGNIWYQCLSLHFQWSHLQLTSYSLNGLRHKFFYNLLLVMLSIDRNYSLIGSTKQCNGINKPNHSIFALYQTIFIIGFMKGVAKDCSCSCCSEKNFRISSQRLSFIQTI